MTIALTTAVVSLATLLYVAIAITGTYTTQNISSGSTNASLAEQAKVDSAVNQ